MDYITAVKTLDQLEQYQVKGSVSVLMLMDHYCQLHDHQLPSIVTYIAINKMKKQCKSIGYFCSFTFAFGVTTAKYAYDKNGRRLRF
jgi:hypothetical protein